jgi:hypothetical protein
MKRELAEEKKYAERYALPEEQARAYLSSIEFLEKYRGLVEDSRDIQWSIGVAVVVVTSCAFIGLVVAMRRMRPTGQPAGLPAGAA